MQVIIYKCDICGEVLSDNSKNPKIAVAHINIKDPNTFCLSARNAYGMWITKKLNFSNSGQREQHYCFKCLIEKLEALK